MSSTKHSNPMALPRWLWLVALAIAVSALVFRGCHPTTQPSPDAAEKAPESKTHGASSGGKHAASRRAAHAVPKIPIAVAKKDLLAMEPAALRAAQRQRPLVPYAALMLKWSPKIHALADRILTVGWEKSRLPPLKLESPIDWMLRLRENTSWNYSLHAWKPLEHPLLAFDRTGDAKYFRTCLGFAEDWVRTQPRSFRAATGKAESESPYVWYDMAVGLRAYQLGYLLDVCCRREDVPDETVQVLWRSLVEHLACLEDERRLATNNHGFFQIVGQLDASVRFSWVPAVSEAKEQAAERLRAMIDSQFTPEGVHREHSPEYHWLVMRPIEVLSSAGILSDAMLPPGRLKHMEEALAWMIQPNGQFANLGDSGRSPMRGEVSAEDLYSSDILRFTISASRSGRPPKEHLKAFPESGLVVMRSGWPRGTAAYRQASYLAQQCAFHSRTHKHADDLSFLWYDHGTDILVDAGRYGYLGGTPADKELVQQGFWYADPKRMYVESTRAHNTVEIDGVNQDRVERKPYGSALLRWGEKDGVQFAESHVRYSKSMRHARVLLNRPHEWLIVFDWLWDSKGDPHQYRQWFQFAPGLALAQQKDALHAQSIEPAFSLVALPLLSGPVLQPPVKGQEQPVLQGWWSPGDGIFDPIWSACWERRDLPHTVFATLFAFAKEVQVDHAFNKTNTSGRSAAFRWRQDGRSYTVRFERPEQGEFHLTCEVRNPPTTQTLPE